MAQSRSPSMIPTTEMKKKQKQEDEQAVASLPEGPLVEILSRVPYRSLCRFKCVSKPWLALCSAPDVRKRSPQTMSGFFCRRMSGFYNLSGRGRPMIDPFLPFLRKSYKRVIPKHCCGGLVLCRCSKSWDSDKRQYNLIVCNPATENWIELPPCPIESADEVEEYLGFDPAVPSRFVVLVVHLVELPRVAIYSSGRWTTVQSGWIDKICPSGPSKYVFLNGTMHSMAFEPSIVTVDTEGKVWGEIDISGIMPESIPDPSIGQSQGRLYVWYIDDEDPNIGQLSVWALENYGSAKWTLKHTVNVLELFGRHCRSDDEYEMLAIHPGRNLIFLTDGKNKTISYDMDNREVHVICTSNTLWDVQPYIPCFADWLPDGH